MAHELDITDGVASFASHLPAWHRLGTVFDTEMTVTEALQAANLAGWNVRKLELIGRETTLSEDGVTTVDTPYADKQLSVRTNPVTGKVEGLGVVGPDFHIVQNEEHAAFLEALLDMSGARFLSTAGALRGGRQVFYSAKLPETMNIGGVDRTDLYVTAMNGHDGSMAFGVIASPIRVVCANTQAAAIRTAEQKWSTRHTKGAAKAIEAARRGLAMAHRFNAEFEAEAERMIQEQLTVDEFTRITDRLFEVDVDDESPRQATNRVRRNGILQQLWHGPTQENIAGTRWAGYNVITEYVDHYARTKGKTETARDGSRAISAVLGDGAGLKVRAFDAFRV